MRKDFLLYSILFLMLFSCTKEKNATNSKARLLTKSGWRLIAEEAKGYVGQTSWVNTYGNYKACEQDDIIVFNANGQFEINEGATKCNSGDPQIIETGTWTLTAAETGITVFTSNDKTDYTIVALNETTLSISFTTSTFGGTYDVRQTLSH